VQLVADSTLAVW